MNKITLMVTWQPGTTEMATHSQMDMQLEKPGLIGLAMSDLRHHIEQSIIKMRDQIGTNAGQRELFDIGLNHVRETKLEALSQVMIEHPKRTTFDACNEAEALLQATVNEFDPQRPDSSRLYAAISRALTALADMPK